MSDAILISIMTSGTALVVCVLGGIITIKVAKIGKQINGRLGELLQLTREKHEAIGKEKGREELKEELNLDTNKIKT